MKGGYRCQKRLIMNLQDFVENFAEQFDDTDPSEITATTNYRELEEWSSMIALSVLNMVEKKCGKHINFDDVKAAVTVEDLYNSIMSK